MSTCPTCGATLSTKLVERITDPASEESCPKFAEVKTMHITKSDRQIEFIPFMDYESAQA